MVAKRPLAMLAATAMGLALAGPALAATSPIGVTYTTADGTRQFGVTEVDGTTALTSFTFDASNQKPFRTLVRDNNRLLNSNGYQVNVSMTNLYLAGTGTHDYNTYIPSSALSLGYGLNPLTGTSTLPVTPKVLLSGTMGTCSDPTVASILGITLPLNLLSLTSALQTLCLQLATVTTAAPISTVANGVPQVINTALSLAQLPFALTGAQQGGAFTYPSYQGPIASGDGAAAGAPAATSKRIMTGTSLVQSGADLSGLLGTLTSALNAQIGSLPAVGSGAKVTLADAESALSSTNPTLESALTGAGLTTTQLTSMFNQLAASVQALTGLDLSSVTGAYDAYPVLQVAPAASKAGSYDGTMLVDFFES